jgi:hypothetical protein
MHQPKDGYRVASRHTALGSCAVLLALSIGSRGDNERLGGGATTAKREQGGAHRAVVHSSSSARKATRGRSALMIGVAYRGYGKG